jgi:hypothetical protein
MSPYGSHSSKYIMFQAKTEWLILENAIVPAKSGHKKRLEELRFLALLRGSLP